jgi:hypothetical protein
MIGQDRPSVNSGRAPRGSRAAGELREEPSSTERAKDPVHSCQQGTFHRPLLDSEADAISDYNDLSVRGFAVSDGGGQRRAIRVTIVEVPVP